MAKMTARATKVLDLVRAESPNPNPEHLMLGIALEGGSVPAKILLNHGIGAAEIRGDLSEGIPAEDLEPRAAAIAQRLGHDTVGTEHLMLALMENKHGAALLIRRGAKPVAVRDMILQCLGLR